MSSASFADHLKNHPSVGRYIATDIDIPSSPSDSEDSKLPVYNPPEEKTALPEPKIKTQHKLIIINKAEFLILYYICPTGQDHWHQGFKLVNKEGVPHYIEVDIPEDILYFVRTVATPQVLT